MSQPTSRPWEQYSSLQRLIITLALIVPVISTIMAATMINVAIPDIMGAFGIDQIKAQWLSTGYLAAMTATMLMTDWASRSFGWRLSLLIPLMIFLAASVLGGISPNENVLILARVLQGACAGVVQPLSMVILFQIFPPEKRGAALGYFGIGIILGPAIGPYVGGVLMDHFSWRYVLYFNVPFCMAGAALVHLFIPGVRPSGLRPSFDWIGFGLVCVVLLFLLNALTNGQRLGWDTLTITGQFLVAGLAFAGFLWWELRTPKPLLDVRLFGQSSFVYGSLASFVLGAGLFATTYVMPLFVQTIQGLTPAQSGLMMMPGGLILVFVFPIGGRLADRLPPGRLIAAGLVLFALSCLLYVAVDVNTTFLTLVWWTLIGRVGLGLMFPALTVGGMRSVAPEHVSQASGILNFTRQAGSAIGVNSIAVILERRTQFHYDTMAATQTADNWASTELLTHVEQMLAQAGMAINQQFMMATTFLDRIIQIQASTIAFRDVFLILALLSFSAIVPALLFDWAIWRQKVKARRPVARLPLQPADAPRLRPIGE